MHTAWLEQHKAFESLVLNLRKATVPLLEARKKEAIEGEVIE